MTCPLAALVAATLSLAAALGVRASAQDRPVTSVPAARAAHGGAGIYRIACSTCHGLDGRGNPQSHVGFDVPLPDFTDCAFATPEVDHDWGVIVKGGGPARAFDRHMPAFGDALSEGDIMAALAHIRTFCTDSAWPRGDLNLPRPLVTEKAFPENEAVVTTSVSTAGDAAVQSTFVYEHRIGARTQWEAAVPFTLQQDGSGGWTRGLGDSAVALKHVVYHNLDRGSIFSVGGEVGLPTGKDSQGLGGGVTIFEPFVTAGQIIGSNGFLHVHAGAELPADTQKAGREAYFRVAGGTTFFQGAYSRAWTPMMEVLTARELESGEPLLWDIVPQIQVSLSRRQHILLDVGIQLPLNERSDRGRTFMTYLLWDWFDGGLFSGWK